MRNWLKTSVQRTPSGRFRWQLISFAGEQIQGGVCQRRSEAALCATTAYRSRIGNEPSAREMVASQPSEKWKGMTRGT